jgi:hypothetical protein
MREDEIICPEITNTKTERVPIELMEEDTLNIMITPSAPATIIHGEEMEATVLNPPLNKITAATITCMRDTPIIMPYCPDTLPICAFMDA